MKKPEEIAREALQLGRIPRRDMGEPWLGDMDRVTAAITAERARADRLAEALRELLECEIPAVMHHILSRVLAEYDNDRR